MNKPMISNWYCPTCRGYVSSQEVCVRKHTICKTPVVWRTVELRPLEECEQDVYDDGTYGPSND